MSVLEEWFAPSPSRGPVTGRTLLFCHSVWVWVCGRGRAGGGWNLFALPSSAQAAYRQPDRRSPQEAAVTHHRVVQSQGTPVEMRALAGPETPSWRRVRGCVRPRGRRVKEVPFFWLFGDQKLRARWEDACVEIFFSLLSSWRNQRCQWARTHGEWLASTTRPPNPDEPLARPCFPGPALLILKPTLSIDLAGRDQEQAHPHTCVPVCFLVCDSSFAPLASHTRLIAHPSPQVSKRTPGCRQALVEGL